MTKAFDLGTLLLCLLALLSIGHGDTSNDGKERRVLRRRRQPTKKHRQLEGDNIFVNGGAENNSNKHYVASGVVTIRGGRGRYGGYNNYYGSMMSWRSGMSRRSRRRFGNGSNNNGYGYYGSNGGGGYYYYVARPPTNTYTGTGIGRFDRSRRPNLPSVARPARGNRFPSGFRPDMIRPQAPDPTPFPTDPPAPTPAPISSPPTTATPTTAAPTLPTGATTPGPTEAVPTQFTIITELGLTYFSGEATDVDRDLTLEEYDELVVSIGQFYTDLFQGDPVFATDFQSYTATRTGSTYTPGAIFPPGEPPSVALPLDSTFVFAPNTAITNNEVLQKMVDANYEDFIVSYLRREPPENQLNNVQQVTFDGSTTGTGTL